MTDSQRLLAPRAPRWVLQDGASLRFEFRPHVQLITSAREFVAEFYEGVLSDPDAVSRVAMATHELLENVLKYSVDGHSHFGIQISREKDTCLLCISVRNRTTPERAQEVERLVAEIREPADPFQMYQRFIRRSALQAEGSGLGLARIRAEAELNVHCQVDGDQLTITAEGPVTLAGKP